MFSPHFPIILQDHLLTGMAFCVVIAEQMKLRIALQFANITISLANIVHILDLDHKCVGLVYMYNLLILQFHLYRYCNFQKCFCTKEAAWALYSED